MNEAAVVALAAKRVCEELRMNDDDDVALHACLKKNCENCFCHKFVKCPPNLIIFGTPIAQRIG